MKTIHDDDDFVESLLRLGQRTIETQRRPRRGVGLRGSRLSD